MKAVNLITFLTSLFLVGCSGCGNDHQKSSPAPANLEEQLIEMHRKNLQEEEAIINNYVKKNKLKMETSKTGMRYVIYETSGGLETSEGQDVTFNYEVRLLDNTLCYSSDIKGPMMFRIGLDDVASGMHEAALNMRVGDKATMIFPSRLGYGLTGDRDRIPTGAILLYDLELLNAQ
jgi:FKBP-type peptidyl-prolyl cis-trans isomerase FkpA